MKQQQWTIVGQLGDRAKVETGNGTVYINAGDDEESGTAMLSPADARALAVQLQEAADLSERIPT
jgi:hypothetical protein